MTEQKVDPELAAIEQVVNALTPLDIEARSRVVSYVFQRLGLANLSSSPAAPTFLPPQPTHIEGGAHVEGAGVRDIRSLTESKSPNSASEMAAIVAYYLKHLAPQEERKEAISREDIEKYFHQANYPFPEKPEFTLPNAKFAGYLDQAGRGLYRLNPVGHNLVVHNLPAKTGQAKTKERKVRNSRHRSRSKGETARKAK
ncbi:MAG: hypothetical protein ABSC89_15220 [Verrucomicrobiota bacterium]|jgi:hypothetical protein